MIKYLKYLNMLNIKIITMPNIVETELISAFEYIIKSKKGNSIIPVMMLKINPFNM